MSSERNEGKEESGSLLKSTISGSHWYCSSSCGFSSQDCNSSFLSNLLSLFFGKGHSLVDQVLPFTVPVFYPACSSVPAPEMLLGLAS